MTRLTQDLYSLLPMVLRLRDAENGSPLEALFAQLEAQGLLLEKDIEQLYENQFIETCEEWAVPYIGDLLKVRNLHPVTSATFSNRSRVANTLGYRRRKGTATMLEQLARDTTGWNAAVVELFQRLGTTQFLNHLRPQNVRTPDLRRTDQLELVGTAFDVATYTADVHGIDVGRRSVNIPNIAIFLWRLSPYPVLASQARFVGGADPGRFTFNPIGLDAPLFNEPATETDIAHLAREREVPGPLRRRPLFDELFEPFDPDGYFGENPVLQVWIGDEVLPVGRDRLRICDLTDWTQPPGAPDSVRVAVDPVLGRLILAADETATTAYVGYSYGFSGDLGGGPYDRESTLLGKPEPTFQVGVQKRNRPGGSPDAASLIDAITAWNAISTPTVGRVVVMDSESYVGDLTAANHIVITDSSNLTVLAAAWPFPHLADGDLTRVIGDITVSGVRPHVQGSVEVEGVGGAGHGELTLNGLLIEGDMTVLPGDLGELTIDHCTLVPGTGSGKLVVNAGSPIGKRNSTLGLNINRSILTSVKTAQSVTKVSITDSIVTGDVNVPGAELTLSGCTILGATKANTIFAENCIFVQPVTITRLQEGCVRFSFVPVGSLCPRRFRCQPSLALTDVPEGSPEETQILARIKPAFTSSVFGNPAFAQLSQECPIEIRTGAEDASEMGAFGFLKNPQRETNLRSSLDEYLRFGLQAGLIFVT